MGCDGTGIEGTCHGGRIPTLVRYGYAVPIPGQPGAYLPGLQTYVRRRGKGSVAFNGAGTRGRLGTGWREEA